MIYLNKNILSVNDINEDYYDRFLPYNLREVPFYKVVNNLIHAKDDLWTDDELESYFNVYTPYEDYFVSNSSTKETLYTKDFYESYPATSADIWYEASKLNNHEINKDGVKFWEFIMDPYLGTNLIQQKLIEKVEVQNGTVIEWWEANNLVNTYTLKMDFYPGDEKVRFLIQSSLKMKNIESKLTSVTDSECPSALRLNIGELNLKRLNGNYTNYYFDIGLCFSTNSELWYGLDGAEQSTANMDSTYKTSTIVAYNDDTHEHFYNTGITLGELSSVSEGTVSKIRYIRDWLNESNWSHSNLWMEIKAIDFNGNNVALGAPSADPSITDGIYSSTSPYYTGDGYGLESVTVDLTKLYAIKDIIVWHYWPYGRTFYGTKTEVSADGVNWFTIFDSAVDGGYRESSYGHTMDANPWTNYDEINSNNILFAQYFQPNVDIYNSFITGAITTYDLNTIREKQYFNELIPAGIITPLAWTDDIWDNSKWEAGTYIENVRTVLKYDIDPLDTVARDAVDAYSFTSGISIEYPGYGYKKELIKSRTFDKCIRNWTFDIANFRHTADSKVEAFNTSTSGNYFITTIEPEYDDFNAVWYKYTFGFWAEDVSLVNPPHIAFDGAYMLPEEVISYNAQITMDVDKVVFSTGYNEIVFQSTSASHTIGIIDSIDGFTVDGFSVQHYIENVRQVGDNTTETINAPAPSIYETYVVDSYYAELFHTADIIIAEEVNIANGGVVIEYTLITEIIGGAELIEGADYTTLGNVVTFLIAIVGGAKIEYNYSM